MDEQKVATQTKGVPKTLKGSTPKGPAKKAEVKQRNGAYAVIVTGGKQYAVGVGDRVKIEKLPVEVGADYSFDRVLFVGGNGSPKIGTPTVSGVTVSAKIVEQDKDKKILVFKKKRRKGYRKKQGHRQPYTMIEITGIMS